MKKIWLMLIILFTTKEAVYATVAPIIPGEALWTLCSRIGLTSDIIESKVCDLDDGLSCDFLIFQSDIPLTITQPGKYCLAESIDFSNSPTAIRILVDKVILDLNCHCMDGGTLGSIAVIAEGQNQVVVKNGLIQDYIDAGIYIKESIFGSQIRDINFATTDMGGSAVLVETSTGVKVENCEANGGGLERPLFVSGANGCFRFFETDDCIVNNCVARNSVGAGFQGQRNSHLCIANSKAQINTNQGFILTNFLISPGCFDHNFIVNCTSQLNGIGFEIVESNFNVIENCKAHINNLEGIRIGSGTRNLIRNCSVMRNGTNPAAPGSPASGIVIENDPISGFDPNKNIILDCVVNNNALNGIDIDSARGCVVRNCEVTDHPAGGIVLRAGSSECKVLSNVINCNLNLGLIDSGASNVAFNNCALGNGTNYIGISLVASMPTTGTGYWANISQ